MLRTEHISDLSAISVKMQFDIQEPIVVSDNWSLIVIQKPGDRVLRRFLTGDLLSDCGIFSFSYSLLRSLLLWVHVF